MRRRGDTYLHRSWPVRVHLSVLVVVTLKLQLQVRSAGGDKAHLVRERQGGVIKHSSDVFSSFAVYHYVRDRG